MSSLFTSSPSDCQNLAGYDSTCNYFALTVTNCKSQSLYLNGILFSNACKKACNLCSSSSSSSSSTLTTIKTTTSITPQAQCFDSQSNCAYWSNYCQLLVNVNPHPCRLTCKICSATSLKTLSPLTTTSQCVDSQTNCIFWTNLCSLLLNQNPHPCRKTCRLC